jgi:hypothetical protein
MPPFNPPAWTYSEGGLWPWYYYIYHDILGLEKPLTAFFGDWAMGSPILWVLAGVIMAGFAAGLIYGMVKARTFVPWKAAALAPIALGLVLWGHTIERIIHYAGVGVK